MKAKGLLIEDESYAADELSLRSLFDLLEAEQAFPAPLKFGPDGDIWILTPTIHGQARVTYPRLA